MTLADSRLAADARSVVRWAGTIDVLLRAATVVAVATIVVRLTGTTTVEDVPIIGELPVQQVWIVMLGFTLLHLFLSFFFVEEIKHFWGETDLDERLAAFRDVIAEEGKWFYRDMRPRVQPRRPGSRIRTMSWRDVSTWVSHGAVIAGMLSVLPWRVHDGVDILGSTGSVAALTVGAAVGGVLNWIAGSRWAIALSELTLPQEESVFIANHSPVLMFTGATWPP